MIDFSPANFTMQNTILLLIIAVSASSVLGFNAQLKSSTSFKGLASRSSIKMSIIETASTLLDGSSTLLLNFLQRVDPEQAKGEFFFFFFGGSGALGIGAAQVPKIAAELNGTVYLSEMQPLLSPSTFLFACQYGTD